MLQPGSLGGSANYRIADDMHRAEAHRRAKETRVAKAERAHRRAFGMALSNAVRRTFHHGAAQKARLAPAARA